MVICLERGADLHIAQLMPLPLTVSCSSKIQIGFTFLVLAYPGCPGKEAVKWLLCCLSFDVFKVCDLLFMAATSVYYGTAMFSSHVMTLFPCAALILFLFWVLNSLGLHSVHCEAQLSSAADTASCIAHRDA